MIDTLRDIDDLMEILLHLREEDDKEMCALGWDNREELAWNCMRSEHVYVARHDGRPCCLFGADMPEDRMWNAWMLATDAFCPSVGRAVKRHYQQIVVPDFLAKRAKRVVALSITTNRKGQEFIEKLGGKLLALKQRFGVNGEDFVCYVWRPEDLEAISRPRVVKHTVNELLNMGLTHAN